ncbi:MAG TPA: hypothetical protein VER78_02670 [Thermoanaerobaculia bacterium]|nr:hypothetical protein [Thermoanaerobaculia bacterium]
MPVDVEKLKRDLSEALTALALGKGYLGIDALADDLEKLGTDYRYLAQAVRSAGRDAGARCRDQQGDQQARGGPAGRRDRVAGEDLISSKHRLENISARVHHQAGVTLGYPPARPLIFGTRGPHPFLGVWRRVETGEGE